jgi:outer membrane protein assembly factor BamB
MNYRQSVSTMVMIAALAPALPSHAAGSAVLPDPQKVYSETEAIQIGWPMMAGPYGNYQPLHTATPIVDDASQIKKVWTTEGLRLGTCKQGTGFGKAMGSARTMEGYLGPTAKTHPGSWGGVIVAEGKVFAAGVRPTGEWVEVEYPDKSKGKIRPASEDFVAAVDFQTGKKIWESVEPDGALWGGGKRMAHQVTPVYAKGKVFAMGSTGRLFAYDAVTGKKLWQSDIGPMHKECEEGRKLTLAQITGGKFGWGVGTKPYGDGRMQWNPDWHTSLVAADDVLVVPTFQDDGFRGLAMADGKILWEKKNLTWTHATPSVYRSGGREYVLSANMNGEMTLIAPKDGKELWKVTGLGKNGFTLSPSDKHVMVNVNTATGGEDPKTRVGCIWGCYKISPEKAELMWKMPEDRKYQFAAWMDCIAGHQETIRDGVFYFWALDVMNGTFMVDVETGKVIAETDQTVGGQCWYLIGDKIVGRINATHANMATSPWEMWSVAGRKFAQLPGKFNPGWTAGAYATVQQCPVVDGRIFERTKDGEINCYDLRAGKK